VFDSTAAINIENKKKGNISVSIVIYNQSLKDRSRTNPQTFVHGKYKLDNG
jgi:hypothetical protein